ncbi:MAG: M48 family metallopeptidase [Actinobacteria bacterium]|nr:M48 family metallopeptidase [Actinomycetota bacterium]
MLEHIIKYGKKNINFSLEREPRKTLKISVLPDLSIKVSAPYELSTENILSKVKGRAPWITKQIDYFKTFLPKEPPRQYISGETHYYFGRQYRLKVVQATFQEVKLKGKYIFINSLQPENKTHTKVLLYKWYKFRAEEMFKMITERSNDKIKKYGIKVPHIEVKIMKSRWGSCMHSKMKIGLNIELIKAPSHCIEYVIIHEMCHFKYPNHTKQFYNFLTLVMPDWEKCKARLEKVII